MELPITGLHGTVDNIRNFLIMLSFVVVNVVLGLVFSERLSSPSFGLFMTEYERSYDTEEEHNSRYWTFYKNMLQWELMNKMEQGTATYGVNQFSDMSEEEFAYIYSNPISDLDLLTVDNLPEAEELDASQIPDEVDWRKDNAVTPVRGQGHCGSCYAFSAVGNVEGQWAVKTGNLLSLSVQEIVDCGHGGCHGGVPRKQYDLIMELGGIAREEDYVYTAKEGECKFDNSTVVVTVKGGQNVGKNETQIAAFVAKNGPVSVCINAAYMMHYKGGVVHPAPGTCLPSSINHAVLIVGYGVEDKLPYWLIKNSWGAKYGEDGYYKLYRGDNSCGVAKMATSAIV